jgi:hypothetical protein
MAVVVMKIVDRSAGMFPVNSVSVRVGYDDFFLNRFSTAPVVPEAATIADSFLVQASTVFKKMWNVELSRTGAFWTPHGTGIDAQPALDWHNAHSPTISCDNVSAESPACTATSNNTNHHFYPTTNYLFFSNYGKGTADITLVYCGFKACRDVYGTTDAYLTNVGGTQAYIGWLSVVFAHAQYSNMATVRTTQHEMSHLFGVVHAQPESSRHPANVYCVMSYNKDYNYTEDSSKAYSYAHIWCAACRSEFRQNGI